MIDPRTYPGVLERVIDGDTVHVTVDHGFGISSRQTVRVARINAPEISTDAGKLAQGFAAAWLSRPSSEGEWPLTVLAYSAKDRYGRRLADFVRIVDGKLYSSEILAAKLAVHWDGKGVKP